MDRFEESPVTDYESPVSVKSSVTIASNQPNVSAMTTYCVQEYEMNTMNMITLEPETARVCLNCSPDAFGEINCSWEWANKYENDGNTPDGMDSGSQWTSIETDHLIETSGSRNNKAPPAVEGESIYEDGEEEDSSPVTSVATSYDVQDEEYSAYSDYDIVVSAKVMAKADQVPPPQQCDLLCTKKINGDLDCIDNQKRSGGARGPARICIKK